MRFKFHELMRALWSSEKTEYMEDTESFLSMQSLFSQTRLIHCKTNSLCWKTISRDISGRNRLFYAVLSPHEEIHPKLKWFTHKKSSQSCSCLNSKFSGDTLDCLINQKAQCFCASIFNTGNISLSLYLSKSMSTSGFWSKMPFIALKLGSKKYTWGYYHFSDLYRAE